MEILHVDVNSAYLSWTAVHLLEKGGTLDIRTVPAVIAGDPNLRQGIVLAKSIPAKKLGIQTGESLAEAKRKCEHLLIFPPEYDLYLDCSDSMYQILTGYSGRIQRYSVDECFLEYDGKYTPYDTAEQAAEAIKEQIKRELGFTVSIGISTNKVLAKMAGELKKPDGVSTIYPYEIEKKLWHLPVSDLFMVGHATKKKLEKMNIRTIGQLACCDVKLLRGVMKSHGQRIWEYANGKDYSGVVPNEEVFQKGIGNSTTFSYDITSKEEALQMLLAICERVSMRLRSHNWRAGLICIYVKTNSFIGYRHQEKQEVYYNSTEDIFSVVERLFHQCWRKEPIRQMGVSVSHLIGAGEVQMNFLEGAAMDKREELDRAVDCVRRRFGERALIRGCFTNTNIAPLQGGVNDGHYMMMGGYRQ